MSTPLCTVLLATFNRRPTLMKCLDHLEENLQVVVIDDGSTDGTLAALEARPEALGELVVLHQANLGPSIARDRGLEHATGPITLFINDDTILEPWAVRTHVEQHQAHPRSMILGTFGFIADHADAPLSRMLTETPHLFAYPLMEDGDVLQAWLGATCNMSVPTSVSRAVGFDHRFFIYAEDVDFALGVEACGYTLRFCADAVGWHDHLLTPESIRKASIVRGVGAARLSLKRGPTAGLLLSVRHTAMDEASFRRSHDEATLTLETLLAACEPLEVPPAEAYRALADIFRIGNMLGHVEEPAMRALAFSRQALVPA
jgi:GT2 family glycosyltransferase